METHNFVQFIEKQVRKEIEIVHVKQAAAVRTATEPMPAYKVSRNRIHLPCTQVTWILILWTSIILLAIARPSP